MRKQLKTILYEILEVSDSTNFYSLADAGLFHSQENDDFVGVVPPCLPSSSTIL